MCYNGSMDRLNVLKGIEGILVEKAYEVGHISHRKGGDWQKQADGSWIPYTGEQSNQNKKDSAPAENTGYSDTVKQDFESVPDSVKDKMFTIAQQYQSEWAEDSDEDVRSMAEGDVEDLAQKLWDTADEETRNSWLGDSDTPSADEEAGDSEDFSPEEYDSFKSEIKSLASGEFSSDVANIRVDPDNPDMPDNDDLMEITDKLIDQFDLSKNLTDEQYEDLTEVVQDVWSQNNPVSSGEDTDEQESFDPNPVQGTEWTGEPMNTEDVQNDVDRADLKNRVLQKMNELNGVQKSAVRDMRSTPVIKNTGF